MGKLNKLEIQFDRSKMVCYSGETLKGTVVIDLNGNLKIKGIRLRFHGYASVHWVERYSSGTGKNKRTVAKHFDAVEQYFDHSAYVFGANKAETHYLPQGVHKFPFEFFVPTGCPTTYEGSIGRVRTYVSATLEKLWVADISTLKPFTVINPLDLNKDPRAKEKSEAINEATFCCLCCKSDPISVKISVDNIGFVPGQAIPITTKVLNLSRRKISVIKAYLHMNVRYHSQKKSKTHQNVIAHMKRNVSKSIDTDVLEDKILIPSIPPSFLNGCNIIDISYILEVIIQPSGLSFDIPVRMELIVGTYPMESTIRSLTQSTIILSSPNSTNGEKHTKKKEIQNGLVVSGNPKSCMSFMESVIGKVTIEDEEESDNIEDKIVYTPVYPYLSVQQNTDLFCVDLTSR
ncbi:arrestin domain-containing protein 3-like isoform X1 [Mytilus edulis]|uniref:arrestin domain-containing protein 3-like isoform X1 n=1 Tax=Mytilus edulis TaxID=6550 RepID=UPI0039EEBB41